MQQLATINLRLNIVIKIQKLVRHFQTVRHPHKKREYKCKQNEVSCWKFPFSMTTLNIKSLIEATIVSHKNLDQGRSSGNVWLDHLWDTCWVFVPPSWPEKPSFSVDVGTILPSSLTATNWGITSDAIRSKAQTGVWGTVATALCHVTISIAHSSVVNWPFESFCFIRNISTFRSSWRNKYSAMQ